MEKSPDFAADPRVRWSLIAQWILLAITLGIAGFCLRECAQIASSEAVFRETLGGKPLPLATQWVLKYRVVFVMAAFFVPCAALATFALRERWQAIGALMALIIFAALHGLFVWIALKTPLIAVP